MSLSDTLRDVERKTINAMGAQNSTELSGLRFIYAGHVLKDTSHPLEMYHFRNDAQVHVVLNLTPASTN